MASLVSDAFPLTLGIIGLGKIGMEVARRARGFEMKVLYHDQFRRQDLEKDWNLHFSSLNELLSKSDIVTIHTNLTAETRGLIGKREISLMKNTAIIINTARGPIIDEEPLRRTAHAKLSIL
jgi:glyoxylate reductase